MKINTFEEFMDLTLRMVRMTETDDELAICAAATIGSLHQRGHNDLALQVLATYEPKLNTCPRCNTRDKSVLLDGDGEPYLCDQCWEDDNPERKDN